MLKSPELPDCVYANENQAASLVIPSSKTPNHSLYLSNLDDQKFLRFSIKYLYIFQNSISIEALKSSLARALVHYYPLAGRLRKTRLDSDDEDQKLEVDCNANGAIFAEAFMDITASELLQFASKPNRSWRKLLFRVDANSFLDIPPLIIQVTNLRCGGMVLCTAINHCICDGIGSCQFLKAWAHISWSESREAPLLVTPLHCRRTALQSLLKPNSPSLPARHLPHFSRHIPATSPPPQQNPTLTLTPTSITFNSASLLGLKRQCSPSLKCTTFEALAAHTWRSWARATHLPLSSPVKLLFSVNARERVNPPIPEGFYGNAFVLGCAESHVRDLASQNLRHGVTCVQKAKSAVGDVYVRSVVEILEDKSVKTDLSESLVISQWAKLGLEDLDFGQGKPLHMGALSSDIYCLFLPVVGDVNSVRVLLSLPETVARKFEFYMTNDSFGGDYDNDHLSLHEHRNGLDLIN